MKTNFFVRLFRFLKARYAPRGAYPSFSGLGEDIVMDTILAKLGIKKASYIDIGAHNPIFGNNTYLFYRKGGRGVLVEPSPELCKEIRKKRPRDICLNAGAGKNDGEADFFAFPRRSTRSTFSKEQADTWERMSGQKPNVTKEHVFSLDTIITKYCDSRAPDIISMDAEGLDVEILLGFSWTKRPKIFCVEAAGYDEHGLKDQNSIIYSLMNEHGYVLSAQVFQNAIFSDSRTPIFR